MDDDVIQEPRARPRDVGHGTFRVRRDVVGSTCTTIGSKEPDVVGDELKK